jgi:hypothetical protein
MVSAANMRQIMLLAAILAIWGARANGSIWDLEYACEPSGEVSTVTFQSTYKERTNFTLIVNWGPYTEELKRTLGESETLSLDFMYQPQAAGNDYYYNRSFEFRARGLVRSITHQKCIMHDGILHGNCCRPARRFRTLVEWPRRLTDRFRNRKIKKSLQSEGRSTDGRVHSSGGVYSDPLAIAVAVVWAALHHNLRRE